MYSETAEAEICAHRAYNRINNLRWLNTGSKSDSLLQHQLNQLPGDSIKVIAALLLAASFPVDWTRDAETLKSNPEFRRAAPSKSHSAWVYEKDSAKRKLAHLERAA